MTTLRRCRGGIGRCASWISLRCASSATWWLAAQTWDRPVRLLDVATGSGRYLDAVSHFLASTLTMRVVPIGLDLSPAMLTQARIRNGHAGPRARHLVGAVETLPFRTASCDVMTCFNAVHHVDLARFADEAVSGTYPLRPARRLHAHARAKPPHDLGPPLSRVRHAGNETP